MSIKGNILAIAVALAVATAVPSAHAQLVTFDPSNFAQSIIQVKNMVDQLKNMQRQLEQQKEAVNEATAQTKAMTGSRGMGKIVTEQSRDYVPKQWESNFGASNPEIAKLADQIKQQAGLLSQKNLTGVNGAYAKLLEKRGEDATRGVAANAQVFGQSNERFRRIQSLMDRIETATDQKAIQDLTARIEGEAVMMQNEALRAQSMNNMLLQQQQVELHRQRQSVLNEKWEL